MIVLDPHSPNGGRFRLKLRRIYPALKIQTPCEIRAKGQFFAPKI